MPACHVYMLRLHAIPNFYAGILGLVTGFVRMQLKRTRFVNHALH